jgi:RNA exonuclease 4
MQALLLGHPRKLIRDTARYPPLMRASAPGRRPKPRALRHLALEHLGLTIQVPPGCLIEVPDVLAGLS